MESQTIKMEINTALQFLLHCGIWLTSADHKIKCLSASARRSRFLFLSLLPLHLCICPWWVCEMFKIKVLFKVQICFAVRRSELIWRKIPRLGAISRSPHLRRAVLSHFFYCKWVLMLRFLFSFSSSWNIRRTCLMREAFGNNTAVNLTIYSSGRRLVKLWQRQMILKWKKTKNTSRETLEARKSAVPDHEEEYYYFQELLHLRCEEIPGQKQRKNWSFISDISLEVPLIQLF